MLNQIIWNKQFIRDNKSSVFFPGWKKIGIENLSCVFDNKSNTLMTFTTFMQKYNVNINFLQYCSLLSAIPQEWKTMLKQECFLPRQLNTWHLPSKSSHAKQFTILYSITSTSLLQLQRKDSLNMALSFTHFLFVL